MISKYKLNIILWYTGLVSVILIVIFYILYSLLSFQLTKEINNDISEKINWIGPGLRKINKPYKDKRFYDYIISRDYRRRMDIDDILTLGENEDEKYLVFIYTGKKLRWVSNQYEFLRKRIKPFEINDKKIKSVYIDSIQFSMTALNKGGYTLYLGYDLSTVKLIQKKILHIFFYVFPIGIILSVLCGYFVTQRSLRVIKSITKTASNISLNRLHERIDEPKGKDEITNLIFTLNSMIDRLEKSFIMVQQFSQDAAHEIRTPLTIIRGEIEEFLKDDKHPENISNRLESILEEIQYLSSLADKLLLIHKQDTSKIEYNFTTVDISRILNEMSEDIKVLSAMKHISVTLNIKKGVKIKGNEELLIRLWWNLIDNSIKYTQESGKVNIKLEEKDSAVVFTIKDTGTGIPTKDLNKIFDRFYRVDKSRSRNLGGSGLGLSICKWIADLHNGEIFVESELDKGSIFIVKIPYYLEVISD